MQNVVLAMAIAIVIAAIFGNFIQDMLSGMDSSMKAVLAVLALVAVAGGSAALDYLNIRFRNAKVRSVPNGPAVQ